MGNYRQKTCPKCGTIHNKRGPFCSRSCGNGREYTEEDKKIRSKKLKEYQLTPEGVASKEIKRKAFIAMNKGEEYEILGIDEFAVDIPDVTDYNLEYDSTWQRAEKW